MGLNKITLMEAYLIETIRSHGVSNDYLLTQVEQEDISEWEELNTNFDFNGLITLRNQNPSAFEDIINEGYSIKFLTFNGLQNLLKRSEEHTSELQSRGHLVCRLLLEKKKKIK